MALPGSFEDREYQRYTTWSTGETAVRVVPEISSTTSSIEVINEHVINLYDESLAVPAAILTNVISYTIPIAKKFYLNLIQVSGENVASFTIDLNGTTIDKKRTYFTEYNMEFYFKSLKLIAGDILKVKVYHTRPMAADFNAKILGDLLDA
jgi:hypothetical protein